jgi:GNAT superfamily N-acetyltransferase
VNLSQDERRSHAKAIGDDRYVRAGKYASNGIAPHAWRYMHGAYVDLRLTHDLVLVADVDGGLAGFIAFSLPDEDRQWLTVHYLYVLRAGRRKGIGRRLFEAARRYEGEAPIRTTHTTRSWQRFLEAMG